MTIHEWTCLRSDWPVEAGRILAQAAVKAAWRTGAWSQDVEDLASEAIVRLLRAIRRGQAPNDAPLLGWLRGVIRNVRLEDRRGSFARLSVAEVDPDDVGQSSSALSEVEASTSVREWSGEARRVIALLPAPYAQIGRKLYAGESLSAITGLLSRWRGVGRDESRKLYRRTKLMIRRAMWGDPRALFPEAYDPKKNRWLSTPPPRF